MYLGEFDFSTNVYVVKITSTKSSYHLESFDSKYFTSGFTLNFGCQLYHTEDGVSSENLFYIVVANAYSGKYKGVVLDMLDAVYRFMESKLQEYAPGSNRAEFKRMIGIHHNRNQEAWSNIARKLGAVEEPRGVDQ